MITVDTAKGKFKLKNSTTVEALQSAKKLLQEVGWIRLNLSHKDARGKLSGFCALGALQTVDGPCEQAAIAVLSDQVRCWDIAFFNDYLCRTRNEMLRAFDRAIKRVSPKPRAVKRARR